MDANTRKDEQAVLAKTEESQPAFLATRHGKFTLALLCSVAFLDFLDGTILNIALPSIRHDMNITVQSLQWIPSAYLLTYGGFMLLGGRAADLFGRRRILIAGTTVFALASLAGGLSGSAGVLVCARLVQGIGAAMMLPAALSILTTSFKEGTERHKALGVWGGVAGGASAAGVLLGGLLVQGPGWRWVLFVNPLIAAPILGAIYLLIPNDRRSARLAHLDISGATLSTGGMLLLVYGLVRAPSVGWGTVRTIAILVSALLLLTVFIIHERRSKNPLLPLSIFRIKGLAAADVTQLIGIASFIAMFFFITLYMQNVLGYSPIRSGLAYLPVTVGVGIAAGVASKLIAKTGTRLLLIAGVLIAAVGVYLLSRIPVHGSYLTDLLPGLVVMSLGLGAMFVSVTTAANAGVPSDKAGLAAALLNASQQLGAALGLAVFSAVATSYTTHLLAIHTPVPQALTLGFQRALLASSICLVVAAVVASRVKDTHEEAS